MRQALRQHGHKRGIQIDAIRASSKVGLIVGGLVAALVITAGILAIFVFGVPATLIYILKNSDLEDIHTRRKFGALYLNYEPQYCPS